MSIVSERAQAVASEHFVRRLTWRDGFALALVIPLAIFATVAPSIAAIGSFGVIMIYAVCGTVALVQNRLFAEMATMFPDKPGAGSHHLHDATASVSEFDQK